MIIKNFVIDTITDRIGLQSVLYHVFVESPDYFSRVSIFSFTRGWQVCMIAYWDVIAKKKEFTEQFANDILYRIEENFQYAR